MCLNAIIDFDSFCAKRPNDVVNKISVHFGYNYQVFQEFTVIKSSVRSHLNLSSGLCSPVFITPCCHSSYVAIASCYTQPTPGCLRFRHSLWLYLFWVSTQFHPLREAFPDHPVFSCRSLIYLAHLIFLICFIFLYRTYTHMSFWYTI